MPMVIFGNYKWVGDQLILLASEEEFDYFEVRYEGDRIKNDEITAFDRRHEAEDYFFEKMKEITNYSSSEIHHYIQSKAPQFKCNN